jgi:hypothetical protein
MIGIQYENFTKRTDTFCVQKTNFIDVQKVIHRGVPRGGGDWCGRPEQLVRKGNKLGGKIGILNENFDFPRSTNLN